MTSEQIAILTLTAYALIAMLVIIGQAFRSPHGPVNWLFYAINRAYINLAFHWRSNRRNPIPPASPAIIIANHTSPTDPMLLWNNHHLGRVKSKPRIYHFVMLKEHYYQRGVSWICKGMQAIPLDNQKGNIAIRNALRQLQQGHVVGIFPEGGINRKAGLAPGNPGVAFLALKSKAAVYPIYIQNAPGGKNLIEPFYNFCRIKIIYGKPIDLSAYLDQKITRELQAEVTDLLMNRLAELGNTFIQNVGADENDSTEHRIAGKVDGSIAS